MIYRYLVYFLLIMSFLLVIIDFSIIFAEPRVNKNIRINYYNVHTVDNSFANHSRKFDREKGGDI
jgi:hypothetical protein